MARWIIDWEASPAKGDVTLPVRPVLATERSTLAKDTSEQTVSKEPSR